MDPRVASGNAILRERNRPYSFTWRDGLRIIDLGEFAKHLFCKNCSAVLDLNRTEKEARVGLASVLFVFCPCGFTNDVYTAKMQTSEDGSKMFEVNIKASINMLLCGTGAQNVINFLAVLDIPLPPQGDLSLVLPVRPHDTSPLCSSSALWTSQKTSTLETLEHGFSPTTCESSSLSNTFRSPVGMPASSDRLSLSTAAQCRTRRETFGYFQSTSTVQMHQDTALSVSSGVSKRSCASACQSGVGEEQNTSPNKVTGEFKEQTEIVTSECRESDDSPECETKLLPDLVEDLSVSVKTESVENATVQPALDELKRTPASAKPKIYFKCPACPRLFSNSRGFLIHLSHIHKLFNERAEDHVLSADLAEEVWMRDNAQESDAAETQLPALPSAASSECPAKLDSERTTKRPQLSTKRVTGQISSDTCISSRRSSQKEASHTESASGTSRSKRATVSKQKAESVQITCSISGCGKQFLSQGMYQKHLKSTHQTDKLYECEHCSVACASELSLKMHISRQHVAAENKACVCKYCNATLGNPHRLKKHIKAEHPKGQPKTFLCDLCSASYPRQCLLQTHMRTHSGEKPYKCFYCEMRFHKSGNRGLHIRFVHKNERSFLCDTCGASFHRACNLKEHERTHTGVRPYQCHVCAEAFTKKEYLNIHIRRHTGEKPYKCEVCGAAYTQRISLSLHRRKVHGVPKQERVQLCYKK